MKKKDNFETEESENEFEGEEDAEELENDEEWSSEKRGAKRSSVAGKRGATKKKKKDSSDDEEESSTKKKKSTSAKGKTSKAKKQEEEEDDELNDDDLDDEDLDEEEVEDEEEEEEEETTNDGTSTNNAKEFSSGAFVVLKTDFNQTDDPPIWKIDGKALLQKYVPFELDGKTLYKNTSVYSGWTINNKDQYYPATVVFKQQTRKEHVVEFQRDQIQKEDIPASE